MITLGKGNEREFIDGNNPVSKTLQRVIRDTSSSFSYSGCFFKTTSPIIAGAATGSGWAYLNVVSASGFTGGALFLMVLLMMTCAHKQANQPILPRPEINTIAFIAPA